MGYDLDNILDPVHQDTKLVLAEKYQHHPSLKALDTERALRSIDFVSTLVRWVDDTYKSILAGVNFKEDVCCITTRLIISIFEDYLAPTRATPTCTSFGSDPISGALLCAR